MQRLRHIDQESQTGWLASEGEKRPAVESERRQKLYTENICNFFLIQNLWSQSSYAYIIGVSLDNDDHDGGVFRKID